MLVYVFIFSRILVITSGTIDPLSILWDDDEARTSIAVRGYPVTETENNVLINRLSKLPFTEQMKFDVWQTLLRYRKVENWQLNDWKRYESLIPYLPISKLRKVNFSDQEILVYFGHLKLGQFQLPPLAENAISTLENIFENEKGILQLGNIICGFSSNEIGAIKDSVLRSLLEKNFFRTLTACSTDSLTVLSKRIKKCTVIGPARTWRAETVKQVGSLLAGLDSLEIKEIAERSISELSSDIIEMIPLETLKVMTDSQLRALNRSSLLTWRRRTLDLRALYADEASGFHVKNSLAALLPFFLSADFKRHRFSMKI